YASGSIIEIKPNGTRATFALGLAGPIGLAFDSAGNLFVADYCGDSNGVTGSIIYKFKPSGARSTFLSGLALNQCFSYLAFQPAQITPEATPTPQPTLPATRATENVLPTPTPWHTPLWSPSPKPSPSHTPQWSPSPKPSPSHTPQWSPSPAPTLPATRATENVLPTP